MTKLLVLVVLLLLALPILYRILKLLFLRKVVGVVLKEVGDKAIARQPDAIHLVPTPGHMWSHPEKMDELAQPLKARGFSDAGVYLVTEMPGMALRFLLNQGTNCYACLYEHPRGGNWVEVITRYQSGLGATYSQQPDRGLERRPEDLVVNAPGSDPGVLYDRMLQERPDQPLISLTEANLPELFEQVYGAQIRWKKARGAKPEEVAKVIASLEKDPIGKAGDASE